MIFRTGSRSDKINSNAALTSRPPLCTASSHRGCRETTWRSQEEGKLSYSVTAMNWRDGPKKEPETNIWGKLLNATSTARQKVTEKYYDIREGGNESDDDTPDNTHTQRVLAQYYLDAEGALPPWLPPPPNLLTGSHRPSNSSSVSSSSMYRAGNKAVSLQDIYDSAGSNSSSTALERRSGRSVDLHDQGGAGTGHRPSVARDRLRGGNLRPTNLRTQSSPAEQGGDLHGRSRGWGGGAGYTGRSGFGIGEDHDPYSYQQGGSGYDYGSGRDQRQGQRGSEGSSRQRGRR